MARKLSRKTQKGLPTKPSSKKAADKENPSQATDDETTKNACVVVQWVGVCFARIWTKRSIGGERRSTLLTLIEESTTWLAAFNFDLGGLDNKTPTGKGKSLIQHCTNIAIVFFGTGDIKQL
jgi:hypothetical protein